MKTPPRDPFARTLKKECTFCGNPPVIMALVQDVPSKPKPAYLCAEHLSQPPVPFVVLNTMALGGE